MLTLAGFYVRDPQDIPGRPAHTPVPCLGSEPQDVMTSPDSSKNPFKYPNLVQNATQATQGPRGLILNGITF